MGAINKDDLLQCRFFHRAPIDMEPHHDESLYDRFVSQRRSLLKILLEDVITSSDKNLSIVTSNDDVRLHKDYLINFSPPIIKDTEEIWNKLQSQKLHNFHAVITQNNRTAQIIRDLLVVYILAPDLIDEHFRKIHQLLHNTYYIDHFIKNLGSNTVTIDASLVHPFGYKYAIGRSIKTQGYNYKFPTENIIMARDYVASLSDARALSEHKKHCGRDWD